MTCCSVRTPVCGRRLPLSCTLLQRALCIDYCDSLRVTCRQSIGDRAHLSTFALAKVVKVSAKVVKISAKVVKISAKVVKVSAKVVKISAKMDREYSSEHDRAWTYAQIAVSALVPSPNTTKSQAA